MACYLGRWRRLKEAVWLLVAVATVTMIISVHHGIQLSWFQSRSNNKVNDILQPWSFRNDHVNALDITSLAVRAHIKANALDDQHVLGLRSRTISGDAGQIPGHLNTTEDTRRLATLVNMVGPLNVEELRNFVAKIESSIATPSSDADRILVRGTAARLKHHYPITEAGFLGYGAEIAMEDTSSPGAGIDKQSENWSVLMCLDPVGNIDDCIVSTPAPYQRVNQLPGLIHVLKSQYQICLRQGQTTTPVKWLNGNLHCYNREQIDLSSLENSMDWWTVNTLDFVSQLFSYPGKESFLNQTFNKKVFIKLPQNALRVNGLSSFIWKIEVLVTSLWPLRAYMHPNGILWDSLSNYSLTKHQKNMSVMDLRQLFTELTNEKAANIAIEKLHCAIIKTFLSLTELDMSNKDQSSCPRCFQVFDVAVMFNSSLHPFILQVSPYSYSDDFMTLSDYLLEQNILEDLPAMLMSREQTAYQVAAVLDMQKMHYVLQGQRICNQDESLCLDKNETIHLLDTRKEQRSLKTWMRLTPTSIRSPAHDTDKAELPIGSFENLVLFIEQYFLGKRAGLEDITAKGNANAIFSNDTNVNRKSYMTSSIQFYKSNCDNTSSSQPYLNAIYTSPDIQLQPEFSPLTLEYWAFVDHATTLIEIVGIPKNCFGLVRLEDREKVNEFNSFSVGIGQNTAHLLVQTVVRGGVITMNTYTILIHRSSAGHLMGTFYSHHAHQVCYFKQDCSLPIIPSESCGLQPTHYDLWLNFIQHSLSLGQCGSEISDGHWIVPCLSCHDNTSCFWANATWNQRNCREQVLTRNKLKECLHQKKVLFIGDSTNRGIMHYLIDRLNGTLVEWEKTHNISLYNDLNERHTIFGFAYYPQFWLPSKRRPKLNKALSQLFKRTPSTFDTIIVLGGAQWLVRRHLDILTDFLSSMQLKNAKVIVKGLGAGFHQPVSGMHQQSLDDYRRLYIQNQAVLDYARSKGFAVVDTFSMTMARYKEFLPGKCACHFHKIVPFQQSVLNKLSSSQDYQVKYTVEGEINAIYSEMIINRICSP